MPPAARHFISSHHLWVGHDIPGIATSSSVRAASPARAQRQQQDQADKQQTGARLNGRAARVGKETASITYAPPPTVCPARAAGKVRFHHLRREPNLSSTRTVRSAGIYLYSAHDFRVIRGSSNGPMMITAPAGYTASSGKLWRLFLCRWPAFSTR